MNRVTACVLGLLCGVTLPGCGDGMVHVTGSVSLDGRPVQAGSIAFVEAEAGKHREGGVIHEGTFKVRVLPGKYRIELGGKKVVGKRTQKGFDGKDETIELTEPLFPERFSTKSELVEEITADRSQINFDLKSNR